jgi:hypothetical protein
MELAQTNAAGDEQPTPHRWLDVAQSDRTPKHRLARWTGMIARHHDPTPNAAAVGRR